MEEPPLEWLYKYERVHMEQMDEVHHNLANQMGHEHEHRLDDVQARPEGRGMALRGA